MQLYLLCKYALGITVCIVIRHFCNGLRSKELNNLTHLTDTINAFRAKVNKLFPARHVVAHKIVVDVFFFSVIFDKSGIVKYPNNTQFYDRNSSVIANHFIKLQRQNGFLNTT